MKTIGDLPVYADIIHGGIVLPVCEMRVTPTGKIPVPLQKIKLDELVDYIVTEAQNKGVTIYCHSNYIELKKGTPHETELQ